VLSKFVIYSFASVFFSCSFSAEIVNIADITLYKAVNCVVGGVIQLYKYLRTE
jgi:hypothetical protein